MRRLLAENARAGMHIIELELAREIGVGTTSVREFLIRFSRFGLIEKRRNSHWVLKGFTREFALELTTIRELFEMRCALAFARLPADHPGGRRCRRSRRSTARSPRPSRPLPQLLRTRRAVPPP